MIRTWMTSLKPAASIPPAGQSLTLFQDNLLQGYIFSIMWKENGHGENEEKKTGKRRGSIL